MIGNNLAVMLSKNVEHQALILKLNLKIKKLVSHTTIQIRSRSAAFFFDSKAY